MKVDKEALLKQHFWILLAFVALLPLICLIVLWTAASDTIDKEKSNITATKEGLKKIAPNNTKNQKWIDDLNERDTKVVAQKDKIWKVAWDAQGGMISFPDYLPHAQEANEKLAFGDNLHRDLRFAYERSPRVYREQYDDNIQMVDPVKSPHEGKVQFKGGHESIIQPHSGTFEKLPVDSDELWLLQEDLAVQRELLRIIKDTNDLIAAFHKVSGAAMVDKAKGEIDHQVFTNPNFKLDLALVEQKGKKSFHCVLTNVSKRRQSLGLPFFVSVKGLGPQGFLAEGEPLAPNTSVVLKQK